MGYGCGKKRLSARAIALEKAKVLENRKRKEKEGETAQKRISTGPNATKCSFLHLN